MFNKGDRVRVNGIYSNKAQGKEFELDELATVIKETDFRTVIVKFDNPVADWHTEETFKHWIDWNGIEPQDIGFVDEITIDNLTKVGE